MDVIRRKELCVVAMWKNDFFSLGKKVSGTQMDLRYWTSMVRSSTWRAGSVTQLGAADSGARLTSASKTSRLSCHI